MPFSPTCSHSTQLFPRNLHSNGKQTRQDRRNRIAADIDTNEAFPDRETNPTDFDKLEGYNPNSPRICSLKHPGQINARSRKWGLGTVQKQSIPGVLRWPFWGPIHHLPKATLPCWKNIIFDIFLQASPFIYYRFAQEFTATVSQSSSTFCSTLFLARLVSISRYFISFITVICIP